MTASYPQTRLVDGELDPEFGGHPANRWGALMRAYIDAQIREAHRQILDDQWKPYRFVRAKISSGGITGDVVVFQISGTETDYTIRAIATLGGIYGPTTTPYFGILAEPCSAGAVAKVIIFGIGIPPSITGLSGAVSGPITFDTTTGRLRAKTGGEPIIGWVSNGGYAQLLPHGVAI